MTGPPRFLADAMLGGLARWLRILGLDAAYEPHVADRVLVLRARADGRTLLTRDRRLHAAERLAPVYLVRTEGPLEQLREVIERFRLGHCLAPFTRCTRCNVPLLRLEEGEIQTGAATARPGIPEAAREQGAPVFHCPICGRLYWEGSHTRRMREAVARALGREV
ncbi:MAG TPA: Mut7-C RNAse domain-containing protein [Gemmatimonadales bacterium]|nr:Mut7-C RNAse domain-containing protein [Gemmatimonadales bacterium]